MPLLCWRPGETGGDSLNLRLFQCLQQLTRLPTALQALSSKALEPSTVSFNSVDASRGHNWTSSVAILETMRAEDTAPEP